MEKELEEFKERPKVKIHLYLFRATIKKRSKLETLGHDGIHGYRFKNFKSIYNKLTIEIIR